MAAGAEAALDSGCSIGDARRLARRSLALHHLPGAAVEADLMVRHVTGASRLQLLLEPDRRLTPQEEARLRAMLLRRVQREPLAYILGCSEFYGLEFLVDRRALIPRPETELLVDKAVEAVQLLRVAGVRSPLLADIGTGSGCVAISLALLMPEARVHAVDASTEALQLAAENCARHGVSGRVKLLAGDLTQALPEPVHVLVANLPYVQRDQIPALALEVAGYEPRQALDGGPDGLVCLSRLCLESRNRLAQPGVLLMEVGAGQARTVADQAQAGLGPCRIAVFRDLGGIERVVAAYRGLEHALARVAVGTGREGQDR